ncbi:MAG: hypothetical protein QF441_08750 [Bacteriovoracaceae bacterium]|jgi:hypothetical protein|nr:hypothetical protein [Bacteriovoracaceae bacterium]|tara:strand:- start:259 stop:417 length:159 start_codon:yes stop_codon:yes gene_type:complete
MKIVAEIVTAIVLFASGFYIAPKIVSDLKIETLEKVDQGLPSLCNLTHKLTK